MESQDEIMEEEASELFFGEEHNSPTPSDASSGPSDLDSDYFIKRNKLSIIVPNLKDQGQYKIYEAPVISRILEEYDEEEELHYLVRFDDGAKDVMSFDEIIDFEGGNEAVQYVNTHGFDGSDSEPESEQPVSRGRSQPRRKSSRVQSISNFVDSSDEDVTNTKSIRRVRKLNKGRTSVHGRSSLRQRKMTRRPTSSSQSETGSESSDFDRENRKRKSTAARSTRVAAQRSINYSDAMHMVDSSEEDDDSHSRPRRGRPKKITLHPPRGLSERAGRRSGRNAHFSRSMKELDEDDIPEQGTNRSEVEKYTGAKEFFQPLPRDDPFPDTHCQTCDVCYEVGDDPDRGQLIFCQGCTIAYHHRCLGNRGSRDHLVTKIGHRDFVLQCRRCVNVARAKDSHAPDQSKCFACKETGSACVPFRDRNTVKQEQREREENDGEDPVTLVEPEKINRALNILFRCLSCYRACHMHHLEPLEDVPAKFNSGQDQDSISQQRFAEYSKEWRCKLCSEAPAEVDGLIAWRPCDSKAYHPSTTTDMVVEDSKEYLIKWKNLPHTDINWMPGAWVWGVTAPAMRKAFVRRDHENNLQKASTEDAVPEEFMRVDIVFDIEYTNVVSFTTLEVDLKRIKEVAKAFVKFKGLAYEEAVWIEPPSQNDTDRYKDFSDAYHDWVMGRQVHLPNAKNLSAHLSRLRSKNFETQCALRAQPESMTGGKLMDYQLEGINWLYYQWFRQQNAILADEMGLGKTIQIIGYLSTLKEQHGCWPFLVVVPNSTCPNWRREIKNWAPGLRTVTYYGSAKSRRLARKYELFPDGTKDLRCHVVVTSYDAAADLAFRTVFCGVRWAGLIVDEGQRLKNDKSILYNSLNALKPPFKILLTGTPLQNNARELFNLLQFLDPTHDAEAMEVEYADLNATKVKELHDKLKPLFLRRTKVQVLTFLPPMAQIIVPVSLSALQRKLYRSILAKNPELIKSIIGASQKHLKQTERANLNNILMQLRKCLCHPFVYSKQIEERTRDAALSHQNLVSASSKLQLLELMLPMLQDRGHRVLIFSQFLDMLDIVEDFLDGLGLLHKRLDGSMNALDKQRRIDEFNDPDSTLFAFLLSTRAGGVGINLATADTVIILDPDFNPHQDIQALSRAHRIGQQKKVLVFQLTTRSTAEEKIMQIGKKKMSLDHALIEQMDHDEDAGMDLESILRHGTEAIFTDDGSQDIKYDPASIEKLLDRSQIEDTSADKEKSAESQFSFAKVWVNEKGTLEEGLDNLPDREADPSLWEKILEERERQAQEEVDRLKQEFGRGRRRREIVDYAGDENNELPQDAVATPDKRRKGHKSKGSESDTDFQASENGSDDGDAGDGDEELSASELKDPNPGSSTRSKILQEDRAFKRAEQPLLTPRSGMLPNGRATSVGSDDGQYVACIACGEKHDTGFCPLKVAGVEYCNLCGLAHYGISRTCAHLNSVTQLRAMVEALKRSPESHELKEAAKKRVVGIIGDLNQRKRKKLEARQHHKQQISLQNPDQHHHLLSQAPEAPAKLPPIVGPERLVGAEN